MTDISTWLLGVYDRQEKVARAATPGPWRADGNHIFGGEDKKLFARGTHMRPSATEVFALFANMDHIIAHDPEKTLARLAALKAIVGLHGPEEVELREYDGSFEVLVACGECGTFWGDDEGCRTLRLLAAAEAHEPGYRQEWEVEP